jgi:hypothetical protein
MSDVSVYLQPTEKVGLIILVALSGHHTLIFTALCGLSVIAWGAEGVHCRWQSQGGGKVGGKINIVNEKY